MPSKYQEYRQMADTAERQLTSSYKSWTQFLRTAARLYKYPYNEQVMIHAQRPDATACAEYDFWNKKMGRFVRRGSTGIALIDTSGQKPQLRYVFDVADTGEREHSRPVHLWQFRAEHEDAIAATLERSYGVSGSNGIVEQMESAAAQLVKEYWVDNKRDILYNIDDSYLDGYDEFNAEVQFRNAAKASITYIRQHSDTPLYVLSKAAFSRVYIQGPFPIPRCTSGEAEALQIGMHRPRHTGGV